MRKPLLAATPALVLFPRPYGAVVMLDATATTLTLDGETRQEAGTEAMLVKVTVVIWVTVRAAAVTVTVTGAAQADPPVLLFPVPDPELGVPV